MLGVQYNVVLSRKEETTRRTKVSTTSSRPRRDTPGVELPRHNAPVLPLCIRRENGYPGSPITYHEVGNRA